MKLAVLSLATIALLLAARLDAQSLQPPFDGPSPREAPRTKRDLSLEGKPRGQRELSAPERDGYSAQELDDEEDDDLVDALRGLRRLRRGYSDCSPYPTIARRSKVGSS